MPPADGSAASLAPAPAPFKRLPMKPPQAIRRDGPDGVIYITSQHAPGAAPRSIPHILDEKGAAHPDRPFLRQRLPSAPGAPLGPWRHITYGEAANITRRLAAGLLKLGLGESDGALLVLSPNSIEHALLTLAAMRIRAITAPLSVAYSTMSTDFKTLRHCAAKARPKAIFVQSVAGYEPALAALADTGATVISCDSTEALAAAALPGAISYAQLAATAPDPEVDALQDGIGPSTVAKILFTSGSTGLPKGVPQTQGAMCALIAAQEGLRDDPDADPQRVPQALDWMPWNHISGANVNFNANLHAGGTLSIDDGRPMPGRFETTMANLKEVSPDVFGSAPIAFAMLADAMEKDPELRAGFFRNMRYMGYGGATLSDDLYDRIQALAVAQTGHRVPLTTMYGATETQGITVVHWEAERVGLIGLPLPGITLKLVPNGQKLEVRVKGPTVCPGYHDDPDKTAAAFDEEGFYKLGDACRFVDEADPSQGLVFDGRVTEDFKLSSGTWVSVGTLRPALVAACSPLVHDAVIAGLDKEDIAILVWPTAAAVQQAAAEASGDLPAALAALAAAIRTRLQAHNASESGSSRRVARFALLTTPPSIDAGEITDKGYVNQRAALDHRRDLVDALYARIPDPRVIPV
jgi:feruloyl-CoA synthase